MNFMKGKLTYTLAVLAVFGGIAGYFLGFIDGVSALQMIWGGLAAFGLRRALPVSA